MKRPDLFKFLATVGDQETILTRSSRNSLAPGIEKIVLRRRRTLQRGNSWALSSARDVVRLL